MSEDPHRGAYEVAQTCIRYSEGNGKLFHPLAAERVAKKCAPFFYSPSCVEKCAPFFYSPSCVDRMEVALNSEIIWSPNGIDRIEECCGGYQVLVGWQEWMLFREWMI